MRQEIMSSQRMPRIEVFRVVTANVDGTASSNTNELTEGYTRGTIAVDTHVYTLVLRDAYARAPVVQITAEQNGTSVSFIPNISSVSTSTIVWRCENDASTAGSPTAFHVTVMGFDVTDVL